ncbi:MAG TPA: preprotein translocase subunit YajC [Acidimicrobiia bacterium]
MTQFVFAQESTGGTGLTTLIFLGLMIAVFYFFIIRPQRTRQKSQQQLATSLEVGQEIRTIGGIHGQILEVDDESVVIKVEEGRLRIARRAVGSRVEPGGEEV